MNPIRTACLVPLLMTLGCEFTQDLGGTRDPIDLGGSSGGSIDSGGHHAAMPLEDLEYPMGLWIRDGKVYFTEAAATDTSYRGASRLSVFDLATSTRTTLVENAVNTEAVAVASDGKIYLGGYTRLFPGDWGHISVVDPATRVELPVVDLPGAVSDLFMDDDDNLFVSAVSEDPERTGVYRLAAGDYEHPIRYRAVDSYTVTASEGTFYLGGVGNRNPPSRFEVGGPLEKHWATSEPSSRFWVAGLTVHGDSLYFSGWCAPGEGQCALPNIGEIRRADRSAGGAVTTVATGFGEVTQVRADPATGKLYLLESGTNHGHYHDGRLVEIEPTP